MAFSSSSTMTRGCPSFTTSPTLTISLVMRPAVSELTTTSRIAAIVPTAEMVSMMLAVFTGDTSTATLETGACSLSAFPLREVKPMIRMASTARITPTTNNLRPDFLFVSIAVSFFSGLLSIRSRCPCQLHACDIVVIHCRDVVCPGGSVCSLHIDQVHIGRATRFVAAGDRVQNIQCLVLPLARHLNALAGGTHV